MLTSINLIAFKNGHKTAYNQIFNLFYGRLVFFACGILDDSAAEDIVQESFIKLWQKRAEFNSFDGIKAFLYLTTKNACLNVIKHQKVINQYQDANNDEQLQDSIDQKIIESEVFAELHHALHKLPLGYRRVLYLNYFKGMSNLEMADYLHLSVNTIKTQKVRGLRILKSFLLHSVILLAYLFYGVL